MDRSRFLPDADALAARIPDGAKVANGQGFGNEVTMQFRHSGDALAVGAIDGGDVGDQCIAAIRQLS